MQLRAALAALALLVLTLPADALKIPDLPSPAAKGKGNPPPTAADVAKLRKKLQAVSLGLEGVISKEQQGGLASSPVAPTLQTFIKELKTTLDATASPKNVSAALERLKAAQAGMADLTKALTEQQTELMHQNQDQEMSLLLGVLMTRRGEPLEKQFEVLRSPEFSSLPVAKELLAVKDTKTPLFQQVALYMDKHGQQGKSAASDQAARLAKSITYFSKRLETLKSQGERMKKVHDATASKFRNYITTSKDKDSAHRYELMLKQSDHEFNKRMATNAKQVKMMGDVVTALKRGDVDALKKAEATLQASMKAMQQKTGGFLHLLQLGHRLAQKDCPYCAAQCIEKCHNDGNPYTQCLTTCADAGK